MNLFAIVNIKRCSPVHYPRYCKWANGYRNIYLFCSVLGELKNYLFQMYHPTFAPYGIPSKRLGKRLVFTNTACVHTYPAYFPAVSGNFWNRSPEWKFFYPIRIRIRVDGRIRKFANTLTSFSWIQSSRRALNKHGVQQRCVFFVNCSDF